MQHWRKTDVKYMPSQENNPWNLLVNTVGFESISGHSSYPQSGHPPGYSFNFVRGRILQEYQLIYITRGKGLFSSLHIQNTEIEEGTVFLIKPGEWHTYRPDESTGWECYWVGFSGAVTESMQNMNSIIRIGYDEEMVGLYRKMLEVSNSERPGYQQLLSGILVHLLAYLFYREKDRTWRHKEVQGKIEKARLIIREKINSPISPEEIAASLNMSYTWFRRMFRQYTGLAPAQYITQLKIQKARELLSVTSMPIKEIALELGYESIDYFSTLFKKQTGATPGQFRNMGKENLSQS
jgi:AraC-like DNA-binding protein